MRLGFDGEWFVDRAEVQRRVFGVFYQCYPAPGVRIAAWGIPDGTCRVNIYKHPKEHDGLTDVGDRAVPGQTPIAVNYEPLEMQMAIMYLVQLYQQLPSEVTHEEA